jgi:predicted permease
MLTECILLAFAGSVVGILLASLMDRGLLTLIGGGSGIALDVSLDARVLAFTGLAATATVILCGFVPAWRATRVDPQSVMKSGAARGSSTRFRVGQGLVVVQCALALAVVTMAGLLVGTLTRLNRTVTGFDPNGVVLAAVDLRRERQGLAENLDVQRAILEGIRNIPGVRDASITNLTPVSRNAWNNPVTTTGVMPTGKSPDHLSWFNSVSPGYFRTLRTRLLQGRDFTDDDVRGSTRVAIVNQAFANRFLRGQAAVGKTFQTDEQGQLSVPVAIVGVVENAKYRSLREQDQPIVYLPAAQDMDSWATPTYIVRSDLGPAAVIDGVKAVAARIDPRISLRFTTLEAQIASSVQRERLLATLSAAFGAVAFLLAMIGLYGVMAYTVARRRVEIGVRIALGAARSRVIGMVLGDVGRLIVIGIAIGTVGAWFATPLLKQFLFGVQPNDPVTIGLASAILVVGALLAGLLPARRAAGLEPLAALRED